MNSSPINDASVRFAVVAQNQARSVTDRMRHRIAAARSERGEGVISAAIAVLIFAAIGAAMWVAYKALFDSASTKTTAKVNEIGG